MPSKLAAALCALTLSLFLLATASASSGTADQSDIWWNPSESGWGMQLAHRGQAIFATVYLYDAQGKPTWISAVLRPAGADWVGDVYATTGPWFGAAAFDPATVTRRVVGSMTWRSDDGSNGTLTYGVDGVTVSKKVVRQPVESDDYAGQYLGALSWVNSCTGLHEDFVDIAVTQVGSNITLNWSNHTTRDACYFGGQLGLDGQFGSMSGQFQCAPVHDDGEFTVTGLRVTPEAITGRYQSMDEDTGCMSKGFLSATRRR